MPRGRLMGGEGPGSADSDIPMPALLGRRARALTGPVTAKAAGNSVVTSDLRGGGQAAAWPSADTGGRAQSTTWGGEVLSTPDQRGEPRAAYGGGWSDGSLTARMRGIFTMFGHSKQGAQESHSGVPNPQQDGPPLPEYLMDNRSLSWQIGTDLTTQEDNPGPFATTVTQDQGAARSGWPVAAMNIQGAAGRTMPLGIQDGVPWSTKVWGGTPGLARSYGQRGGTLEGPGAAQFALPGDGSGRPVGTLLGDRPEGDGPQMIEGGPPHGLHTYTAQPRRWTMARQASIPQQKPGRNDRPNNSKLAGQSFNQTVVPEGKTGSGRIPRQRQQQAGITQSRFLGRSG
ncbi:MAG TPA: hypothetical protein VNO54_24000 [Streptosporangiaceae bacterium]|nr:hypothetical protein [Streptosporangiaceae bacterium]